MKDVAKLAGVSSTTVSFVINDVANSNIPAETQARVLAAVEELQYRPNVMARGLRAQRTHTIGFLSDEVASTPFAGRIIQGAQELAWEHNYLLLLINTGTNRSMKEAAVETLLDRQVDGIIYATMYHRQVNPPEQLNQVPTVLLDCFAEDRAFPSVVPADVQGARDATSYLLARGHRRVAFINDIELVPAQIARLQGYKEALAAFDVPFQDQLVCMGHSDPRGGYECGKALLSRPDRPTALFCFNDRMAMGVYDAARELGLSIPHDVAVVGYDNHEIIAAHLQPPLTTMQLPHYEMGTWAVKKLLQLIGGEEPADAVRPIQHLIQCPIIERASV